MLVLSRKPNEEILIGDDIRVVVLEIRGHLVKLGLSAPKTTSIHRAEVVARIQAAAAAVEQAGV